MKQARTITFGIDDLELRITDIERLMGYDPGTAPDPIPGIIDEVSAQLGQHVILKGGYTFVENPLVDLSENIILLDGIRFSTGRIVTRMMKGSVRCALFVCTAGETIMDWSRKVNREGDPLKAYVIDLFGSELAEALAQKIQDLVVRDAGINGLKITNRYSPGYCGWPVSDQKALFTFFPPGFCDIRLSHSCLMIPLKSISGIIGIGPGVKTRPYTCHACGDTACIYRNIRQK